MIYTRSALIQNPETATRMHSPSAARYAETPEDAAFFSGMALARLSHALNQKDVPQPLVRNRLALQAAEVCVAHLGRPERTGDLRDAIAFLQPGAHPGPAGAVYLSWQIAAEHPISTHARHRGTPVAQAVTALLAGLDDNPQDRAKAVLSADTALAQALGWSHVVPLLGIRLNHGDLDASAETLRLACHQALTTAAEDAIGIATDLACRTRRLKAVVPGLRARGADEAIAQFLTRDAIAPAALTSLRSDRAARRFCDRLVALRVVRELTGRDTFRLYGV